jgi:predicted MFS family arabinose efflux permease
MAILAEPIKREFALSDTQVGLLTGLGFAIFFGIGGIPIGMLVDRVSRKRILAASVAVFSVMTALGGAANSFLQILAVRSLLGAGEAGGTPSMSSILSDLYPPEKRVRAMAIFYAGNPLGAVLAFLIGGAIAAHWGWRATFVAAAAPGLLLVPLLLISLREPVRRTGAGRTERTAAHGLGETLRFILRKRSLRHVVVTPILTSAASAGVFVFASSLFLRVHGLTIAQTGLLLAVFYGMIGVIGTVIGGILLDRLTARDERWQPWFCALSNGTAAIGVILMALAPSFPIAVLGMSLIAVTTTATLGPLLAMLHALVASRMRGTATAILYFLAYLIGAGSGPWIVGLLSDQLLPTYGADSIRYGIVVMAFLYVWGGLHFWMSARCFRDEVAHVATL